MEAHERLEQLMQIAGSDGPEPVDVGDRVLFAIRDQQEAGPTDSMLLYVTTAFSTAAAITVGLLSMGLYQQLTDPFIHFLFEMSGRIQ
jgi:hypothetical protein